MQNAFHRLKCLSPNNTSSEQNNLEDTTIIGINNHKKENAEYSENCKNSDNLLKQIDDLKVHLIEAHNMLDCFKKSDVALAQLSLTLHYSRRKFYYQHYIHI